MYYHALLYIPDNMELLEKYKIETVIALSLIGCLLVLFFSGCSGKSESFLTQYEERNLVKDSEGNQYKIVYKSKFPQGYGCFIFFYNSSDKGKTWAKLSTIKIPFDYLTYVIEESDLCISSNDILYFVCARGNVIFSKSVDRGKIWSETNVVYGRKGIWHPIIFVDSQDIIYILCGEMLFTSDDDGETWAGPDEMRTGNEPFFSEGENGIIYLSYVTGKRQNIIFLSYSKDRGKSWHTETTGELPMMVKGPYAIVEGSIIYLVFQGAMPTVSHLIPGTKLNYQIYYLKSNDRGKIWGKMIKLKKKGTR